MDTRKNRLAALASIQALTEKERQGFMKMKHAVYVKVLTRNMLAFFETSLLGDDGYPDFTMQELTESLADALMKLGENRKLGHAVVQTLIYELQDRVNSKIGC